MLKDRIVPKSFLRYAFLSITLSAFAAGCTANLEEILEDYKKTSGLTYTDCGQVSEPSPCFPPTPTQGVVQTCLLDAFSSCKPAQARIYAVGIEGDSIAYVYFVAPDGKGGCKIDFFYAITGYNDGPQSVTQS